jgi:hypothetical protein
MARIGNRGLRPAAEFRCNCVLPSANVFDSHAALGFALQVRANKVWPVHTGKVGHAAY